MSLALMPALMNVRLFRFRPLSRKALLAVLVSCTLMNMPLLRATEIPEQDPLVPAQSCGAWSAEFSGTQDAHKTRVAAAIARLRILVAESWRVGTGPYKTEPFQLNAEETQYVRIREKLHFLPDEDVWVSYRNRVLLELHKAIEDTIRAHIAQGLASEPVFSPPKSQLTLMIDVLSPMAESQHPAKVHPTERDAHSSLEQAQEIQMRRFLETLSQVKVRAVHEYILLSQEAQGKPYAEAAPLYLRQGQTLNRAGIEVWKHERIAKLVNGSVRRGDDRRGCCGAYQENRACMGCPYNLYYISKNKESAPIGEIQSATNPGLVPPRLMAYQR